MECPKCNEDVEKEVLHWYESYSSSDGNGVICCPNCNEMLSVEVETNINFTVTEA